MSRSVADYLNSLSVKAAGAELERCCGASAWVEGMVAARPFDSDVATYETADQIWRSLAPRDWLEAFRRHPRIGERGEDAWARQEQSGAADASDVIQRELAEGNQKYEERFGHVFLISATGLTVNAMLSELKRRLANDPEREIETAALEQAKITRLRLEKLGAP